MPVVEGCLQADVGREQHAVAEDVAGHVADAGHRKVGLLYVDADLAEVPLDALPGAAGGDGHLLVVIALRAAGGERITEPVVVVGGDRVGDVREGRRPLVGGDHQVGVVSVGTHHLRRRDDLAGDDVVGQIK